jgi:hypothetical protein
LSAESPDRVLHKAWEVAWKLFVELFRIYPTRDLFDNFRTPAIIVAARPVWMLGSKPRKNSCPMKEFMHQRVDGDHAAADLVPMRSGILGSEQDTCERHAEHFVGQSIYMTKRAEQRLSHSGDSFGPTEEHSAVQSGVDPIDQIGIGYVAEEKK